MGEYTELFLPSENIKPLTEEMLDIEGMDAEKILSDVINNISEMEV